MKTMKLVKNPTGRRYGYIDHDFDRAREDGLLVNKPIPMDKEDCVASVERWQRFANTHPEPQKKLVAQRRIARALIAYQKLITPKFAVGDKVQVLNKKRKALMQETYLITKVIELNGAAWYALKNAVGLTLSPCKASQLEAV